MPSRTDCARFDLSRQLLLATLLAVPELAAVPARLLAGILAPPLVARAEQAAEPLLPPALSGLEPGLAASLLATPKTKAKPKPAPPAPHLEPKEQRQVARARAAAVWPQPGANWLPQPVSSSHATGQVLAPSSQPAAVAATRFWGSLATPLRRSTLTAEPQPRRAEQLAAALPPAASDVPVYTWHPQTLGLTTPQAVSGNIAGWMTRLAWIAHLVLAAWRQVDSHWIAEDIENPETRKEKAARLRAQALALRLGEAAIATELPAHWGLRLTVPANYPAWQVHAQMARNILTELAEPAPEKVNQLVRGSRLLWFPAAQQQPQPQLQFSEPAVFAACFAFAAAKKTAIPAAAAGKMLLAGGQTSLGPTAAEIPVGTCQLGPGWRGYSGDLIGQLDLLRQRDPLPPRFAGSVSRQHLPVLPETVWFLPARLLWQEKIRKFHLKLAQVKPTQQLLPELAGLLYLTYPRLALPELHVSAPKVLVIGGTEPEQAKVAAAAPVPITCDPDDPGIVQVVVIRSHEGRLAAPELAACYHWHGLRMPVVVVGDFCKLTGNLQANVHLTRIQPEFWQRFNDSAPKQAYAVINEVPTCAFPAQWEMLAWLLENIETRRLSARLVQASAQKINDLQVFVTKRRRDQWLQYAGPIVERFKQTFSRRPWRTAMMARNSGLKIRLAFGAVPPISVFNKTVALQLAIAFTLTGVATLRILSGHYPLWLSLTVMLCCWTLLFCLRMWRTVHLTYKNWGLRAVRQVEFALAEELPPAPQQLLLRILKQQAESYHTSLRRLAQAESVRQRQVAEQIKNRVQAAVKATVQPGAGQLLRVLGQDDVRQLRLIQQVKPPEGVVAAAPRLFLPAVLSYDRNQ